MENDETNLVTDLLISDQESGGWTKCRGIGRPIEQARLQQCEGNSSLHSKGFFDAELPRVANEGGPAIRVESAMACARWARIMNVRCRCVDVKCDSRECRRDLARDLPERHRGLRFLLNTDAKVTYKHCRSAMDRNATIGRKPAHPRPAASKMNAGVQLSLTLDTVTCDGLVRGPDEKLTEACRSWARDLGLHRLAEKVSVVWHSRLSSTAGNAYYHNARINLNPRLQTISLAEITRTLKHELAHLVANERAGRKTIEPHGPEWRQACRDLGIPNEPRCHDLPLPRRRQTPKYAYQCPRCEHVLLRIRSLRRHAACYECCRRENGGNYASAFAYRLIPLSLGLELAEMQAPAG